MPEAVNIDTSQVKWRQVEHLQPGHWWLGEYEVDGTDTTEELWGQVFVVMHGQLITTGQKTVRVRGVLTDGARTEMHVYRGHQVQSLSELQGAKAGLKLPEPEGSAP